MSISTLTKTLINSSESLDLAANQRIVVVIDPTTLTGGTVLADYTVPAGKTMKGTAIVHGEES